MSGTGQNNRAPTRLTPMGTDQPIGNDPKGTGIWPSMWFAQMIERLLSYVGQPVSSNTPGQTISSQVGTLNTAVDRLSASVFARQPDRLAAPRQIPAAPVPVHAPRYIPLPPR